MRDRAIGMLLFFTGIRGCDISCMKFSDIDWEKEEIRIIQQKTANGLILPMSAAVGNAIYDYVTAERPSSEEPYIFLCRTKPYSPLSRGSVWKAVSKVYGAAGIRQGEGEHQGTHLFRHHVASALVGKGIARPVITHQFRHAKATHWLEDGMNIIQISFLLGHVSLDTTMRYLDITTDDKRKALATLENEKEKNVTKKWKDSTVHWLISVA